MVIGIFFGYTIYKIYLRGNILALIKNFFIIGLIGIGLMSVLFFPLVKHMLTYDHAMAYSAYAVGYGVATRILVNFLHIGPELCLIFFFALWAGWRYENEKIRPLTIFLTAWIAASDILISRIQFMGMQHYYTILVPFCIVITAAIMLSFKRNKKICAALVLIVTFNFAHAYWVTQSYIEITVTDKNIDRFKWFKYAPPIRNDVDELRNFIAEMNKLTAGEKKVYLVSSSGLYNYSSFKQIAMPDVLDAMPNLMGTADVDLRDGFPIRFFDADFVITTEPVQTHLQRAEDQAIVTKLSELVTSTPLKRHFKLINKISLYPAEGTVYRVTLKVYKKNSPFDKSDIDFVENVFSELYPDNPSLFKDRFENYKAEKFNE